MQTSSDEEEELRRGAAVAANEALNSYLIYCLLLGSAAAAMLLHLFRMHRLSVPKLEIKSLTEALDAAEPQFSSVSWFLFSPCLLSGATVVHLCYTSFFTCFITERMSHQTDLMSINVVFMESCSHVTECCCLVSGCCNKTPD